MKKITITLDENGNVTFENEGMLNHEVIGIAEYLRIMAVEKFFDSINQKGLDKINS